MKSFKQKSIQVHHEKIKLTQNTNLETIFKMDSN